MSSKDGLVHKFKLRPGAKWSDGQPVTLEEARQGLLEAIDPKTAGEDGELLFSIKGARPFFEGKLDRDAVAIKVVGEELIIELNQIDPTFFMAMTMPMAAPKRFAIWDVKNPTTGRYFVKNYKVDDQIDLEPNPSPACSMEWLSRRVDIYR